MSWLGRNLGNLASWARKRLRWFKPRPRRTPTILQMEAVECGAAALAIVMASHSRWVPLEELRIECGVSRDGSKASNVVKAARRYGLKATGSKREPASLRIATLPAILHWNFNHFVVLEGFHRGQVLLNDPATGPRTVSEEELDEAFTGVVLEFEPGPEFEPGGQPRKVLPALKRRLVTSRAGLLFVVLAGLALVVPGLAIPAFSKIFVDNILLRGYREWLVPLLVVMACTGLLVGVLTWLQQIYLLRLETKISLSGSARFLWHVLHLPSEFFTQRLAGDISSRVAINDRVARLLSRDLATNILGAGTVVFFAVVLLRFDPALTLVGFGVVALNALTLALVSRRRVDASRRLLQEQGKLQGVAYGGLASIETLKATGSEADLFGRWSGYQAKVVNIRQGLERWNQVLDAVPPLLAAVNTGIILGLGSLRVIDGSLTLGGLIAFQALMVSFTAPVSRLVGLGGALQSVQGDMERLDDVLRYPIDPALAGRRSLAPTSVPTSVPTSAPTLAPTSTPTLAPTLAPTLEETGVKLDGQLELRGISFGYSHLDPPLIEEFDLVLKPGARVALVGGSGSGKSTIARLIAGLYAPWEGEILFDGEPAESIPRAVLNHSMSVVDQNIFLFEGTVRENLTLWDPTTPLPEVVTAARDAAIHDDVAARNGGYDSMIEEGGRNWSGGQQQRLEIARALVGDPSLLLLDEATSALDANTEEEIDRNLRRRGSTCLIVAHRLSTIRDADEIVVLEQGKVVERGSHEDLMARGGSYAGLIAVE